LDKLYEAFDLEDLGVSKNILPLIVAFQALHIVLMYFMKLVVLSFLEALTLSKNKLTPLQPL
jgi:hypothetical protein